MSRFARKCLVFVLSTLGKAVITVIALGFAARAVWEALRHRERRG